MAQFDRIEDAIQDLVCGKVIIVVDNESRENEGEFVVLAEKTTPEIINFMIKEGRGLVCVPITEERASELELPQMVAHNADYHGTAFTVSIDHVETTTGISAHERSQTIRAIIDPNSKPQHFCRPGHIFPLVAKSGGVLRRRGHTEAAIDLAGLCNAFPAAVICEVIKENGLMARIPDLMEIAKKHGLKMISISDLIQYRRKKEILVIREVEVMLPTAFGMFKAIAYTNQLDNKEHIALVQGEFDPMESVLVRVHSECLTGDAFNSGHCECGQKLASALQMINDVGKGVLLYLRQDEMHRIGLVDKLKAYSLWERELNTVEERVRSGFMPDLHDYDIGAQILKDLGIQKMRLMTNNPHKKIALDGYGLEIVEWVALQTEEKDDNVAI